MIDIALAAAFVGLLVASFIVARSITAFSALVLASVTFLGTVTQFIGVAWRSFTLRELQAVVLVGLLLVLIGSVFAGRKFQRSPRALILTIGSLLAIAVGFAISRALAPGDPDILSGVGYLITRPGAEDNAKWLNATSQLAQGAPVDTWANVGGPLLLLFTLCATFISAISVVLYGGVNQVAVAADTVILAEHLLVIVAPFALAPLIEMRIRRNKRGSAPVPILLLAIIILLATVAWPLEFGHVTLQFVLLAFTLWSGLLLIPYAPTTLRAIASLGVALLAMVWFPIAPLSVVILLGLLIWAVAKRMMWLIGASLVSAVLLAEYVFSTIRFSIGMPVAAPVSVGGSPRGVSASNGVFSLFDSPGGTAEASTLILILTALSVIGAVYFYVQRGARHRRIAVHFAPVILLGSYAWLLTVLDFWAVGEGPNYASLKVVYATILPILATTIVLALLSFEPKVAGMSPLRWAAIGSVLVVLTIDPFVSRIAAQMRPELWPGTSDFPYWAPAEVRATGDQPLSQSPIACIYLPPGSDKPTALPFGQRAYSCSRLLTGLAGVDYPASAVVRWQLNEWLNNTSLWDQEYAYFTMLDPSIKSRPVILLDARDQVVGIEPFERLINRYEPVD